VLVLREDIKNLVLLAGKEPAPGEEQHEQGEKRGKK